MTSTTKNLNQSEEIHSFSNEKLGYSCHIALSGSKHGHAIGGCRLRHYVNDEETVADALALARAMRNKAAVHGLPLDGGNAVINVMDEAVDRAAIMRDFARHVDGLSGRYITAVDVGTTPADLDIVAEITPYAVCTSAQLDAAYFTALGVFSAIKASAEHRTGARGRASPNAWPDYRAETVAACSPPSGSSTLRRAVA